MKKLIVSLFALMVCMNVAHAGLSDTTTFGELKSLLWEVQLYDTISTSTSYDALKGATIDSTIPIKTKWRPAPGWQYVLAHDSLTGAGCDSVECRWMIYSRDNSGDTLCKIAFDTTSDANGAQFIIPIGSEIVGHWYDVFGAAGALNSGSDAWTINRVYIYRRRPLLIEQNWQVGR
jgi:hypothetical protein